MPVRMPTPSDLRTAADRWNFDLTDEEVEGFSKYIGEALPAFQRLDELVAPTLPVKYPRRDFGHRPPEAENNYNGWAWRCSVPGAADGPLAGKKVGLKDHIKVAGIPMMNSCSVMEGYVPAEDATIVTRLLDAGAEIIGKAVNGLRVKGGPERFVVLRCDRTFDLPRSPAYQSRDRTTLRRRIVKRQRRCCCER